MEEPLRRDVYRRLASLSPPPRDVSEAAIVKLDASAMTAWRDSMLKTETRITW